MAFQFSAKRYKYHSNEKFDEYLQALGVKEELRKRADAIVPVVEVIQDGDTYKRMTYIDKKTTEVVFKSGVEFDDTLPDGTKSKAVITVHGNKFVEVQRVGDKSGTITREFSANEMKVTYEFEGAVATRTFKAE